MRIAGEKPIFTPKTFVLPREGKDFVFTLLPVIDLKPFETMCPAPKPVVRHYRDGRKEVRTDNAEFQKLQNDWAVRKINWIVLQSLKGTSAIEWEKVDENKPDTWSNVQAELMEIMSPVEYGMLLGKILEANGMSTERLEEAQAAFLAQETDSEAAK